MTVTRKTLLLYAPQLFCLRQFLRMKSGLSERGWDMIVVSHRVSVWLAARMAGTTCYLLRPADPGGPSAELSVADTPAVKLERLSVDQTRYVADSVHQTLLRILSAHPFHAIGLWNGLHIEGRVATALARSKKLKTIYFELGNIEPKLFIDPEGVNAASRLARDPGILRSFSVTEKEISDWQLQLRARCEERRPLPQSLSAGALSFWSLLDRAANALLRIPQPMPNRIGEAIRRKLTSRFWKQVPEIRPKDRYVFLPLQLREDTNLVLFSQIDNFDAIEHAARRARELGLRLVVKPHPAERDTAFLSQIHAICEENCYFLTKWNVIDLVLNSEEVFVINSSVGLQAIALSKKLTILGNAFYRDFSQREVVAYALKYLLDFDPFGSRPASADVISRIVALLEAK